MKIYKHGSTTCIIPDDGTKPQNTEGTEVAVLENLDKTHAVGAKFSCVVDGEGKTTAAVFLDNDANAYAATSTNGNGIEFIVSFLERKPRRASVRMGTGKGALSYSHVEFTPFF